MQIQHNFSLKNYNTFGIEAKAKQFVAVHNLDELQAVLKNHSSEKKFILGGGSNMLLTQDIDALVIHIDLKGKKIIKEDDDFVWVESQAGFDEFDSNQTVPGNRRNGVQCRTKCGSGDLEDQVFTNSSLCWMDSIKHRGRFAAFRNDRPDVHVLVGIHFYPIHRRADFMG